MVEEHPQLQILAQIQSSAEAELNAVMDENTLQQWRVTYLGRNSALMKVFSQLPQVDKDIRPLVGQRANQVKIALEGAFSTKDTILKQAAIAQSLTQDRLDVTLPGRRNPLGRLHPVTETLREVCRVFSAMGFQVFRTREVETDDYNFGLLNMPPHHPARDMWETFHTTTPGVLLRTHTSPGQIHAMRRFAPNPIRVVLPGMCYRYEQVSVRSGIQFTQVEGLMVGENVTFSDLKGTLAEFYHQMYGPNVRTRFRASYFPFTEPSAEMDVECFICGGSGCAMCKNSGWLELLGCGMVHPVVLQNGGYDPDKFTGFAFGMGPERTAILRYAIDDIRNFWTNDLRFLEQI